MYRPFFESFPQLASDETRNIFLEEVHGPRIHKYSFLELYCIDPTCDCRRVLFYVIKNDKDHAATITYGFDPGPMQGPHLDPLNRQTGESEEILCMAKDLLLNDESYLKRLERHYHLVKASLDGDERSQQTKQALWQQQNKLRRKARKKQRRSRK